MSIITEALSSRTKLIDLVLWGAGGHGKVVFDVAKAMGGFDSIVFMDDVCTEPGQEFCGTRSRKVRQYLRSLRGKDNVRFLVSIGNNEVRAEYFQCALDCGLRPITLIHPSAVISASAEVLEGTVVMPKVVINAGARIGKDCIVNTSAVVEHDCQIGDHVHLSPGVVLGGGVIVHSSAHIGIGAMLLPKVEIGEGSVAGAGTVVLHPVPSGTTVVGNPARVLSR